MWHCLPLPIKVAADISFGRQYGKMADLEELHIQRNNMNTEGYIIVLQRHFLPLSQNLGDLVLMEDTARCHRNSVSNSFKNHSGIWNLYSGLPACSPNFNPIENVWSLWKLCEELISTWRWPLPTYDPLARSMAEFETGNDQQSDRELVFTLRQVIKKSGEVTKMKH